jgi:hypothetical protein
MSLSNYFQLLVLGSPEAEILGNMFCRQGKCLVNFLDVDHGRKPGVCFYLYTYSFLTLYAQIILTERTWAHNNTVMVNTSAYTEMVSDISTCSISTDCVPERNWEWGRQRQGCAGTNARIGDLMRCAVVMQVEDRSRSEIKGCDVYDWVCGPYKAVHNSDVLHRFIA